MSPPPDAARTPGPPAAAGGGTNSIEKACAVLRALAGFDAPLRLIDIAAAADLHQATAARILETLAENGLVRRHGRRRLYALSPLAGRLGQAGRAGILREAAHASVLRLSVLSDDTAMLSVRCGDEALYIAHEVGRHPIRVDTLGIGRRRPLGVGVGALALLAALPPGEAKAALDRVEPALARFPLLSRGLLEREAERARTRGHALVADLITPGGGGVAVAIRAPEAGLTGAVSVVGPTDRILAREAELAAMLREEAALIRERLLANCGLQNSI